MKAKIHQINIERDVNGVCFMGYDRLAKLTSSPIVDMSIYDMVYEADFPTDTLEGIFRIRNCEHPADYTARSLSVSDIVEVRTPKGEMRMYFCDNVGFVDIQEKRKAQLLSAALDWIWEHTESVDDGEFERVLKEHLGMTNDELSEYCEEATCDE